MSFLSNTFSRSLEKRHAKNPSPFASNPTPLTEPFIPPLNGSIFTSSSKPGQELMSMFSFNIKTLKAFELQWNSSLTKANRLWRNICTALRRYRSGCHSLQVPHCESGRSVALNLQDSFISFTRYCLCKIKNYGQRKASWLKCTAVNSDRLGSSYAAVILGSKTRSR